MTRWWLPMLCVAAGCRVSAGSAYVGQWRERDAVKYRVCIEDETGACEEEKVVTEHVPARRFWGFAVIFPNVGVSRLSVDGRDDTAFRMEMGAEFLRGTGRWALGGRVTSMLEMGHGRTIVSVPVMATGHFGLSERFSVYGAFGLSPYNRIAYDDPALDQVSHDAVRGLVGMQIVLSRSHVENRIMWSFELDRMWSGFESDYESVGLMSHLELSL